MNGGKKEDYENMSYDDIQLIYATYNAYQTAMINKVVENVVKLFGGE